jgi:hypothetical protein
MQPEPAPEPLAYLQTSAFEWTERAFELQEEGRLHVKVNVLADVLSTSVWGECPRCSHPLGDRQVHTALVNETPDSRGGEQPTPADVPAVVVVDVTCGCDTRHDEAADDVVGCGASFRLELEARTELTDEGAS